MITIWIVNHSSARATDNPVHTWIKANNFYIALIWRIPRMSTTLNVRKSAVRIIALMTTRVIPSCIWIVLCVHLSRLFSQVSQMQILVWSTAWWSIKAWWHHVRQRTNLRLSDRFFCSFWLSRLSSIAEGTSVIDPLVRTLMFDIYLFPMLNTFDTFVLWLLLLFLT